MRRRARRDSNHAAIRDGLRQLGVWVWDTAALGDGFPDLLVCHQKQFALLEVKDGTNIPSKRRLTADEADFFASCPGPVFRVHTLDEALEALAEAA